MVIICQNTIIFKHTYFIDYNWHLSTVKITFLLLKCLFNSKSDKVNILQTILFCKIEQYNKIATTFQSQTYPLYIGILMMLENFSYRKHYIGNSKKFIHETSFLELCYSILILSNRSCKKTYSQWHLYSNANWNENFLQKTDYS